MSEVFLFPLKPDVLVMVGWSRSRGKFYIEIEFYASSLDSPDKKTIIDMGFITHKDLDHILRLASTYAKVPDDLYTFLSQAAKCDNRDLEQLKLPFNHTSQQEAKGVA